MNAPQISSWTADTTGYPGAKVPAVSLDAPGFIAWGFICGECGMQAQSEHRSVQCPGCGARRSAVGPPYRPAR